MSEIAIQVKCPHCNSVKGKKNGKKRTGKQNFLCRICHKQFQYVYLYTDANPSNKSLVCSMILNGSGIRDIHRVLKLSIIGILSILRNWFRQHKEPCFTGIYKQVQIDEFWTFVKHRKQGKRWVWYAYDKESKQILAFHIGKRNDRSCNILMKKLSHSQIGTYCTDSWKFYQKHIPQEKHITSKKKTTH